MIIKAETEGSHFCGLFRAKEITAVVETQGKARNSVNISKCGLLEVTEGLSHHTVSFHIVMPGTGHPTVNT